MPILEMPVTLKRVKLYFFFFPGSLGKKYLINYFIMTESDNIENFKENIICDSIKGQILNGNHKKQTSKLRAVRNISRHLGQMI